MQDRRLRLRALLDRRYTVIVVSLLALAAVGGWVTYGAHAEPGTTTVERNVSSWSMTGSYDHSATVTDKNPVEPVGTTLSDRPMYFTSVSPVVSGTFRFQYTASGSGNLDISLVESAVVRSVESGDGGSTELWRDSRTLETRSRAAVSPSEPVTLPFSVDAPQIKNRTARIEDSLGNPPGDTQFAIVTTVALSGTVNGQQVNRTEKYALPVTFENGAYRLNATPETREFVATETVTVPSRRGPIETLGGPFLLVCSLAAAAGFVWKNDTLELTDTERERLQFHDDRDSMEEWINKMRLPDEIQERERIEADSLAGLVDFAIDTNNSVIEDDGYYVLHDGMLYTYEPPETDMLLPDGRAAEELSRTDGSLSPIDDETTDGSDD